MVETSASHREVDGSNPVHLLLVGVTAFVEKKHHLLNSEGKRCEETCVPQNLPLCSQRFAKLANAPFAYKVQYSQTPLILGSDPCPVVGYKIVDRE